MVDGEAGGGGAGRDSQLTVDRAQVDVDGVGTDDQLRGDLDVCQPLCQQVQHLDFSIGQSRWVGCARSIWLGDGRGTQLPGDAGWFRTACSFYLGDRLLQ